MDLFEMTRAVRHRSMEPFPVVIRALDALHISTALLVSQALDGVTVFSHDTQMNLCARAIGLTAALG